MVGMSFSRHSLLKNAYKGFLTRNPELERGYTKIFNKVNKWLAFEQVLIRLDLNSRGLSFYQLFVRRVLKLDRQVFHLDICEKNHEELQVWKK